jgi:hypothetical protein
MGARVRNFLKKIESSSKNRRLKIRTGNRLGWPHFWSFHVFSLAFATCRLACRWWWEEEEEEEEEEKEERRSVVVAAAASRRWGSLKNNC